MSIHLHSLNAAVVKNTCKILQNLSSNQTSSITECHRRAWRVPNTPPVYFWWRMMDLPSSKPSSVHSWGPPGQSSAQTPERAWLGNSFLFLFYFVLRKKTQTVRRGFRARPQRAPPEVKWRAEAWGAPSSHSSSARTEHNEEPKPRSRNIATAAWALGTRKWSERTKEKKKIQQETKGTEGRKQCAAPAAAAGGDSSPARQPFAPQGPARDSAVSAGSSSPSACRGPGAGRGGRQRAGRQPTHKMAAAAAAAEGAAAGRWEAAAGGARSRRVQEAEAAAAAPVCRSWGGRRPLPGARPVWWVRRPSALTAAGSGAAGSGAGPGVPLRAGGPCPRPAGCGGGAGAAFGPAAPPASLGLRLRRAPFPNAPGGR